MTSDGRVTAWARLLPLVRAGLSKHQQLVRFLIVGGVNTVFGYSMFALLYVLSHRHNLALVGATILGVIFNFFTTGRIVFRNKSWGALLPFCMAYAVALGINFVVLNGLLAVGVSPLIGQGVSLPVVVVVSYLINAKLVFRTPRRTPA